MSLRYSGGEASMDEPALRDLERWKDKIEVRLDNRQVFFLFFGSAMVACMLFVLGVIVGKRLESRGKAEAPPFEDPLAVLDRFGAAAAPAPAPAALTFPRALLGTGAAKGKAIAGDKADKTDKAEKVEKVEKVEGGDRRMAERAVAVARVNARPTLTAVATPLAPSAVSTVLPPPPSASSKRLAALPRPLAAGPVPPVKVAVGPVALAKEPSQLPKSVTTPIPKPLATPGSGVGDRPRGRFLLQLSSFQERGEAEAFARRFAAQSAYVVATEIPGKGTWYRVRVGSYGSLQEASAAKTTFEREHNVIAYVAGPGPGPAK